MKRIMILGATYTQVPLIQCAKEKGYYVIVAGTAGDYPGNAYADELCDVDISSPNEVFEKAKALKIDGIATCCMDLPIRAVGFVCDRMNLTGLSENAAVLSNHKHLMKCKLVANNIRTPQFIEVFRPEDAFGLLEKYKCIVLKALDLQASRGVYVCNTKEEIERAYKDIIGLSKEGYCIAEQFVNGIDIGAQAFVYDDEIFFVLPHNDEVFQGSANKPIGHSAPLLADGMILDEINRQCRMSIKALGLNNCAVNIDMILTPQNEVYMIELTGRAGATCLPEIVSKFYGVNYYEMIVEMAMGNDPKCIWDKRKDGKKAVAARFITSNRNGVLKEISFPKTSGDKYDIASLVRPGDNIRCFNDGKDRLGEIIVADDTLEGCFEVLKQLGDSIEIHLE